MSKRGNLDNVVTYEHICDTTADMQKIDSKYITLGSTCIVISGDTGGMEVYIANSNKTWSPLGMISGGGGGGDSGGSSGSGITVIECELTVDHDAGTAALTHADQLKAALDDMTENPAHGFNYGVCMHRDDNYMLGFAGTAYHGYGFMTINTDGVAYRADTISGNEVNTYYYATDDYKFQATDIDENGTATLTYNQG
jgi:hypothetical protein